MIKRVVILTLCLIIISSCRFRPQVVPYTVYLPVMTSIKSTPIWGIGSTYRGSCLGIWRSGASWYYNWTMYPESCPGVEPVAMIWDSKTVGIIPDNVRVILWFNEPDQPTQADMTPQVGAVLWNEHRLAYSAYRNGSPAAGVEWLADWLKLVDEPPDFLCAHIYESRCDFTEAQRRFKIHLDRYDALAEEYDLPIWLTEYAWATDSPRLAEWVSWSKEEIARHPRVERAAWFQVWYEGDESWAIVPNTSLADRDGELNKLGLAYRYE